MLFAAAYLFKSNWAKSFLLLLTDVELEVKIGPKVCQYRQDAFSLLILHVPSNQILHCMLSKSTGPTCRPSCVQNKGRECVPQTFNSRQRVRFDFMFQNFRFRLFTNSQNTIAQSPKMSSLVYSEYKILLWPYLPLYRHIILLHLY